MLYPDKDPFNLASNSSISMFDKALGSTLLRKKITEVGNYDLIKQIVDKDIEHFRNRIKPYKLYE